MKKTLLILAIFIGGYFIAQNPYLRYKYNNKPIKKTNNSTNSKDKSALSIVFFQDVSGSIQKNGVELINASLFAPYFNDIDRDIELNFGCINKLSAMKLISLELYHIPFKKPLLVDLKNATLPEKRNAKETYIKELTQYQSDSTIYFTERTKNISAFCQQVNTLMNYYAKHLSSETDLVTAITIADKVFNYSKFTHAQNFLILNSDGLDSYHRTIKNIHNNASVILVNASGITHTSIDNVVTQSFQSPEEAIQFSLFHY